MHSYITELLHTNARVIIPDLGAFIVKQKKPLTVVFNEFMRYNDGLLVDYIKTKEGLDKEAARDKVFLYAKQAAEALDTGKQVVIGGLGKLTKDDSGKIVYTEISNREEVEMPEVKKEKTPPVEKNTEVIIKERVKGTDKPDTEAEIAKPAAETKTADIKTTDVPLSVNEPEKKSKKEIAKEMVKETSSPKVIPVETVTTRKVDPTPVIAAPVPKPETVFPATKPRQVDAVISPVSRERKKVHGLVWLILVVIALGAIGWWMVENNQLEQITQLFAGKTEHLELPIETPDEPQANEEPVSPEDIYPEADISRNMQAEKIVAQQPEVIPAGKRYYIVAGCFRNENNADQLLSNLRKNGYDALKFGKIGNLHAVSYASFPDRESATTELRRIRNTLHPEAWMIYQ